MWSAGRILTSMCGFVCLFVPSRGRGACISSSQLLGQCPCFCCMLVLCENSCFVVRELRRIRVKKLSVQDLTEALGNVLPCDSPLRNCSLRPATVFGKILLVGCNVF